MTDAETEFQVGENDAEMARRIRPLVNEILKLFNERQISPAEAGMVVMSLTYRLLGVLKEIPEARRHFILTLINLINNFLAEEMQRPAPATCGSSVEENG